jgi:site-specific DNA-methyltransferase (adenine-specific)
MKAEEANKLFSEVAQYFTLAKRVVIVLRHDVDPRFLVSVPALLPFFRIQILPYAMPGYIGRKLGGDEIAYCFGEPLPSMPGKRVIPGYAPKAQPQQRPNNGHPCSRVISHFRWLVEWWSLPGETILDPFMGSGVTLRAARAAGRKAIGMDIEEKYCKLTVASLNNPEMILEV